MPHPQCPYCQRVNPPDSSFCNACGAPLHLLPCPHCGAVNDAAATKCYQCAAALREGPGSAPAASSSGTHPSVAAGSAGTTTAESAPEADALDRDADLLATLQELRQRVAEIDAGTAGRGLDRGGNVDSSAPDLGPGMAVAPWAAATSYPTPAVALPSAPRPERRIALARSPGMIIGTAALAAVVVAGYYAFDRGQIVDASKAPAAAGEVKDGGDSAEAVPPASPDTTSAEVAPSGSPAAPLPPVTHGVAPSAQPPTASVVPTQPASASRPGGAPQPEGPVTSAAPAAAAASARPRPAETSPGIERPPPPRLGPCTDAVAALGLCTPEPTQRRE
jgi:hypothetical protein